jgi:transcriptional regulator with XRE-family HTH domain
MPRTLSSPQHLALRDFLVERRNALGLTQQAVADAVGRSQSYIAAIETAQRRVDVVELIQLAEALKFDPAKVVRDLRKV